MFNWAIKVGSYCVQLLKINNRAIKNEYIVTKALGLFPWINSGVLNASGEALGNTSSVKNPHRCLRKQNKITF